jgi:thiopurine S-methyltransferase
MNASLVTDRPAGVLAWNAEAAAESLRDFFGRGRTKKMRALVPSAAMIEEAVALSQLGFETFVVDPDAQALARVKKAARDGRARVEGIQADFLNLRVTQSGPVELIVDRLYVHALEPVRRAAWVYKAARILPEDGVLAGLFLIGHRLSGPPYPITREALRHALSRNFETKSLDLEGEMGPDGEHAARGLFRRR